jgi:hypothetical protein
LCGFLQLHITYFFSWVQVLSSARSCSCFRSQDFHCMSVHGKLFSL